MKFLKYNLLLLFVILFTGCDEKIEIHHLYPQEFRNFFMTKGINVDDYGVNLTKTLHRSKGDSFHSTGWNPEWKSFIIANPNASKNTLEKQLQTMLKSRNVSGRIHYINYITKKPTGSHIDTFGRGFLSFIGVFGNWIITIFGASSPFVAFLVWLGSATLSIFGINSRTEVGMLVGVGAIVSLLTISVTIWYLYPIVYAYLVGVGIIGIGIVAGVSNSGNYSDGID